MKKDDAYLKTSLWYKEKITDPYQVIAEFFSSADIAYYRKSIKDILMAASSANVCSKSNPGNVLYRFERLESVINAAYLLNREKKQSPLDIGKEDVFNPNLYCGWQADLSEWDFFPRILTLKEYINPYLVFKRFFKYHQLAEWKKELQDLLQYALITDNLFEVGLFVDTLSSYFHLTKLVEAAHLIDVREINHIGGHIKNRAKKNR